MTDLWREQAAAEGISLDEARRRYPTEGDVPGSGWDCGPPMSAHRDDLSVKAITDEIYEARIDLH